MNIFNSRIFSLLLFFTILGTTSYAQKATTSETNGNPSYFKFDENQKIDLKEAKSFLQKELTLSNQDELRLYKEEVDQLGYAHQKFQQYYQGVKVENGIYTIHSKEGKVSIMNGQFLKFKKLNTNPGLSESAALNQALKHIGASKYMWETASNESFALQTEAAGTFKPKGELVIIENYYAAEKAERYRPVLAWKFNIYAEQPLSRDYVYVEAQTGKIAYIDPIIKKCFVLDKEHTCSGDHQHDAVEEGKASLEKMLAAGTAATRYSGSRTIEATATTGGFRLRETTRGNGINTYDCNTGTNYNSAVDFVDNDNNWTAGEWNNAQKDNAALDAHWGSAVTYDYWLNTHNRDSWNGNGAAINSYVHFDANYNNAFWNGSVMTYGDGSGAGGFDALTSLDVAAHEIGHAICETTANLAYRRESGALNEGFSDIWGAAVEFFAAPNKDTWLIGEDIEMRSGHVALRSMSNPNQEGQPDTYGGTNWINPNCGTPVQSNDYCGVHTNSGVLNFWFYLLTTGGSGTNDNNDAYTVSGIGIVDAAKIAYRLESQYLGANSTFADARTFGIQSAADLFGAGSAAVIATTNAFYAVGVGSEYGNANYCASQGNSVSDEWIGNVQIGSFSNPSGAQGYSDFTNLTVNVNAGSTYATTLTPTFSGTAYSEHWRIWVDLNEDSDFDDAGEELFSAGGSNAAVSGNIVIPASAAGITTRMRISMKYNAAPTPCEAFSYGEVEDYTISISGGATCSTPTGLSISSISQTTATASWSAVTGAATYDVRFRQTGATSWTSGNIAGTAANMTGLTANTNYEVQVRANCTGANSAYTSSANFTTSSAPPAGGCTGGITAFPYSEGFESGFGGWSQGSGDDFDWARRSGTTPSSNTGPSSANEGSFYMYVEASAPNYSAKVTILNSPCFDLSGESAANFNFDYHMYGASNMGNLNLEASDDNGATWSSVWSASGNQGNAWLSASVNMGAYTGGSVQLRFVGTTGSTWQGDMAVDNISVDDGSTPTCVDVSLTLVFDDYQEETSWSLTDGGGAVIESGGTYGSQADRSTLVIDMCVFPGCYDFTINDAYGDGICCTYGNGSYVLAGANGTILASGGTFTSSETTNVCPNASTVIETGSASILAQQPAQKQDRPEFAFSHLEVYPNPASEVLNVQYESEVEATGVARIIDLFGKVINQVQWDLTEGQNNYELNLQTLPQGTYLLEINDGSTSKIKRFVVTR